MKPIYLPAIGHTTTGYLNNFDDILIGTPNYSVSPRFYNTQEDSYYKHPYILVSAANHYRKYPNIRESLKISPDTLVFVDSGGYQLATGVVSHKKYNSKIALEWSEINGNIFPILDHPITEGCDIQERLKISCDSAKYYTDNRTDSSKKILNVVSGPNLEVAEVWYNKIKQYPLDGWAHGGHRGVLTPVLQIFMMLGNNGEFNKGYTVPYHIFGVSSQVAFIYISILQLEANKRGWDVQIMSDSSSFQITLGHGGFMLFPSWTSMANIRLSNKFDYTKLTAKASLPCECTVCQGIEDIEKFIKTPAQFYLLGAIHNLAMVLRYKHAIDNIIHCGVSEIMLQSFPSNIVKNIIAIQDAMVDPEKGILTIKHSFTHREEYTHSASLEEFF